MYHIDWVDRVSLGLLRLKWIAWLRFCSLRLSANPIKRENKFTIWRHGSLRICFCLFLVFIESTIAIELLVHFQNKKLIHKSIIKVKPIILFSIPNATLGWLEHILFGINEHRNLFDLMSLTCLFVCRHWFPFLKLLDMLGKIWKRLVCFKLPSLLLHNSSKLFSKINNPKLSQNLN